MLTNMSDRTYLDRYRASIEKVREYLDSLTYHVWVVDNLSRTSVPTYVKGDSLYEALQNYFKNTMYKYTFNQTGNSQGFKYHLGKVYFDNEVYAVSLLGQRREDPLPVDWVAEMFFDKDTAKEFKARHKNFDTYLATNHRARRKTVFIPH